MGIQDLPTIPIKGQRRNLDERWLGELNREGLAAFRFQFPEPPASLDEAVAQFNRGQYWQCHETLERIWLPEQYPLRLFYQGLIKAAVGLLHLEGHNRRGARAKLKEAARTLAPFSPSTLGIDVDQLRNDIIQRLAAIEDDSPLAWEDIGRLSAVLIRK